MKEIIKKPWDYSLYERNNQYILSVVCGTVAIFEITIKLNEDEEKGFLTNGLDFIESLSKQIQYSPNSYSDRNIEDFNI